MSVDTRSSTVTAGATLAAGMIVYPDMYGIPHTVTNGQTFLLTSVDDSSTGYCRYYILPVAIATGMTTTDGLKIKMVPGEVNQGPQGFLESQVLLADATTYYNKNWTIPIKCPVSGVIQYWNVTSIYMSDLDFSSTGTMTISMSDQFGNDMTITAIPVGVAA